MKRVQHKRLNQDHPTKQNVLKGSKTDVSNVSPSTETLVFESFKVANLPY